jgi:hypothetical protein
VGEKGFKRGKLGNDERREQSLCTNLNNLNGMIHFVFFAALVSITYGLNNVAN